MIEDLTVVHRYDQRGVGGSSWEGHHTLDLHLQDLDDLLDGWDYDQVVLVGHSYGTDLAARYCLRRPDRVAGLVLLAGPFLGPWRDAERHTRQQRMTEAQCARLAELEGTENRTEEQEEELLTLLWFPDHDDQERAWLWASSAARTRRPVNALLRLGRQLDRPTVIIPGAGHEPWLEGPDLFRHEFGQPCYAPQPSAGDRTLPVRASELYSPRWPQQPVPGSGVPLRRP